MGINSRQYRVKQLSRIVPSTGGVFVGRDGFSTGFDPPLTPKKGIALIVDTLDEIRSLSRIQVNPFAWSSDQI